MERMKLQRNAAVAGFLIGLGVIINTLASSPILGAALFSFGLLTIIHMQLPLYTGQIGFITEKKISDLFWILIFNFIGIMFAISLKVIPNDTFTLILQDKANIKFSKTLFQMFTDAFLCGTLIHFAVKCKQHIITIMTVMIFILIGAEHCIADFPYLIADLSLENCLKFFIVVMGNSVGAIFLENILKKEGKN